MCNIVTCLSGGLRVQILKVLVLDRLLDPIFVDVLELSEACFLLDTFIHVSFDHCGVAIIKVVVWGHRSVSYLFSRPISDQTLLGFNIHIS